MGIAKHPKCVSMQQTALPYYDLLLGPAPERPDQRTLVFVPFHLWWQVGARLVKEEEGKTTIY